MKQLDILESIAEMEAGMQRATDNADAQQPEWTSKAYSMLVLFTNERLTPFRCEEFRLWCEGKLMPPPHDRAFGTVMRMAAKDGLIRFYGYDKTENPKAHRANCAKWVAATVADND